MKLDEYIKQNNIHENVARVLKEEYKAMCVVDIERYADVFQKRMKNRAQDLTVAQVLDDFFYEVSKEGEIKEIKIDYGLVPAYIDTIKFGKQFILRKTERGVLGCYYKVF